MRPDRPLLFGNYLLWDRLRIGGTAELWRATRREGVHSGQVVAIKRLLPTVAEDSELLQLFLEEAVLVQQLQHENIVQVYDSGAVGASHFIAMEYVGGQDLRALFERARVKDERIPAEVASFIIVQACDGLHYAHEKADAKGTSLKIVHQDVSPQNILLSYRGNVKITDFGLAANMRLKGGDPDFRSSPRGKRAYMSPEQSLGLPIDRRADIFAAGVCLYELLTGYRFSESTGTSEGSRRQPLIDEELDHVVMRALREEPEARYQTAKDLGNDLRSYVAKTHFGQRELGQYLTRMFPEEAEAERTR